MCVCVCVCVQHSFFYINGLVNKTQKILGKKCAQFSFVFCWFTFFFYKRDKLHRKNLEKKSRKLYIKETCLKLLQNSNTG